MRWCIDLPFLLMFADSAPIVGLSPKSSGLPCPHCRRTHILAIVALRISKSQIVSIQQSYSFIIFCLSCLEFVLSTAVQP